jgi:adenosine deaminase
LKPEATPELVVETAKKYAAVFNVPKIDRQVMERVVSELASEYSVHEYLATEAERLYKLEQNPDLLVFQNSRVTYMVTDGNQYWQTIKAVKSNNPTLADMKHFINTLIQKYGEDKQFSATSDRGDEFFSLRLKER